MEDKDFKGTQEAITRLAREAMRIDTGGFLAKVARMKKLTENQIPGQEQTVRTMERLRVLAKGVDHLKKVAELQLRSQLADRPVDLSKPLADPGVCPNCKAQGMKQSRNSGTGAWTFRCERGHTWEGIY